VRMGGPGLGKGLISECEYNLKSFGCCLLQDVVIKGVSFSPAETARTNFVRFVRSNCTKGVFPGRDPCFQSPGYKIDSQARTFDVVNVTSTPVRGFN
jgi:hypothetical protein